MRDQDYYLLDGLKIPFTKNRKHSQEKRGYTDTYNFQGMELPYTFGAFRRKRYFMNGGVNNNNFYDKMDSFFRPGNGGFRKRTSSSSYGVRGMETWKVKGLIV